MNVTGRRKESHPPDANRLVLRSEATSQSGMRLAYKIRFLHHPFSYSVLCELCELYAFVVQTSVAVLWRSVFRSSVIPEYVQCGEIRSACRYALGDNPVTFLNNREK
jgi:hypothetical protein